MKYLILTFLFFYSIFIYGQDMEVLYEVNEKDTIHSGQSIIYGNFIQRLGVSGGGYPQDIRIINIESGDVFSFRAKSTSKSSKENPFCFFIEPGTYAILNYWWTKRTWYGGQMHTEPIYKGIDSTDDLEEKINSGNIKETDLIRFIFEVEENTINYVGTWHFDTGMIYFSDDKAQLDKKIKNNYKKLDFTSARTGLPK